MWENLLCGEYESFLRFLSSQSYETRELRPYIQLGVNPRGIPPVSAYKPSILAVILGWGRREIGKCTRQLFKHTHSQWWSSLLQFPKHFLWLKKGISSWWSGRPAQSKSPTGIRYVQCLYGELLGWPWSMVSPFLQEKAWTTGQSPAAWSSGINCHCPNEGLLLRPSGLFSPNKVHSTRK